MGNDQVSMESWMAIWDYEEMILNDNFYYDL